MDVLETQGRTDVKASFFGELINIQRPYPKLQEMERGRKERKGQNIMDSHFAFS